jgi:hypothetical protein
MRITIKDDFTATPGARKRVDGPFSGEEFRERFLEPYFDSDRENRNGLIIDMDGTEGYAGSFIDEAFGGIARKVGTDIVLNSCLFLSEEDPALLEEIVGCIRGAELED